MIRSPPLGLLAPLAVLLGAAGGALRAETSPSVLPGAAGIEAAPGPGAAGSKPKPAKPAVKTAKPKGPRSAGPTAPTTSPPEPPGPVARGPDSRTWSFESDKAGAAPSGFRAFRTGAGSQGRWVVVDDVSAPSAAHALAQTDLDGASSRIPHAVVDQLKVRDLEAKVRCRFVAGDDEQFCGLVFRWQDPHNYYLVRANPLDFNIRLYLVRAGKRRPLASYNASIPAGPWHELAVAAKGDHFDAWWNGQRVLWADDSTWSRPGLVGLATKGDALTHFDDFTVEWP